MAPKTTSQLAAEAENIMLIVGRLMEGTRAASEGIKALNEDGRKHAAGIFAAEQAITNVQRTLVDLERIVRSSGVDSLVTQTRLTSEEGGRIRHEMQDLAMRVDVLVKRIDTHDTNAAVAAGGNRTWETMWQAVSWIIPTAIALAALFFSKG